MRKRLIKTAIGVALLVAVGFGGYTAYRKSQRNEAASCANCRSFIHRPLSEYAAEHDGWYPKGGKDPLDSLAKCVSRSNEVHYFTSHSLAPKHMAYWKEHGTFSSNYCCYRYVEGLRSDDPAGLVMLYYGEPTRWECNSHKKPELGRPVYFNPPAHWQFVPENVFQQQLSNTLAYLAQQGRRE